MSFYDGLMAGPARRQRVKAAVALFAFAVALLVSVQGKQSSAADVQLPMYVGLVIAGMAATMRYRSAILGAIVTAGTYLLLSLPTVTIGYFRGYDSWKYIGSTRIIATNGWDPTRGVNVAQTNQFPGVQLLSVVLSETLGAGVVPTAKYLPVFLNGLVLALVFATGRIIGLRRWEATLPTIAVASYFLFVAFSSFHHLLLGYVGVYLLLFMMLKLQGTVRRRRWLVLLLVGMATLSISHQYSSLLFGVLLGSAMFVLGIKTLAASDKRTLRSLWSRRHHVTLVLVYLLANVLYYLWLADEFILATVALLGVEGTVPAPSPRLVAQFVLLYTEPLLVQVATSYLIVGVFLLVAGVGAILFLERAWTVVTEKPDREVVLGAWITTMLVMVPLAKVVPVVSSIRRVVKFAVPLLLVGLVLEWAVADRRRAAGLVVRAALCGFVVLGLMMYPSHIVGDHNPQYDNRYDLTIYEDQRAGFEFAYSHSDRMVAGTMARQYLEGSLRGYDIVESQSAYLNCGESQRSLLLVREGFRRVLFMRSQSYQYAVPDSYFHRFDRRSCLSQVYDNGQVRLYLPSTDGRESAAAGNARGDLGTHMSRGELAQPHLR